MLQVTDRSFLLLSSRMLPGVCAIAPIRAPTRSTVHVAAGGVVETVTVWLLPFTIVAQADKRVIGIINAALSMRHQRKCDGAH